MGSWFQFLGLCILTLSFTHVVSQNGTIFIDGRVAIASIDDDFICATLDWWPPEKCDYGTCAWGLASLLNMDLNNTILLNAVKAFAPLKIRLGGTLQDKVIYDNGDLYHPCRPFRKNSSVLFGFTEGCLPMSRWDELNEFFKKSGAVIIFGLNALNGRYNLKPDTSAVGPWNSSNAASLIRYSVNKGYNIYAWELGNELSGNGVGAKVAAAQYASDVMELYSVVEDIYKGFKAKPLIVAPGGFFDANWFKELVDKTPNALDVVTHHIYNLGPGVDDHLVEKILDPSYLDGMINTFSSLEGIVKSGTSVTAWVGEAGGAYNSGRNHVTNAFVFSFWYLDQLGMSSIYDTKTYCRQTLIGGNYGLLNTTTYVPNPDYYSALLWNRLMGRNVLKTSFSGTKKIRAYSHCAKHSPGITLLLINLDGNNTVQVHVTTESLASHMTLRHRHKSPRSSFARMPRQSIRVASLREEYHLTAKDGDLHSQTMLLNGRVLALTSSGDIPPLEPISINPTEPITVAPYSIVFAHIPDTEVPACN